MTTSTVADQRGTASWTSDDVLKLVCSQRFHQCLWLPDNQYHAKLRVCFATTSNFSDNALPAVLFCGPMFGSRWNAIQVDQMATKHGVRVICVDRPGIGGSTSVALKFRMQVWLETVPALLDRLGVRHVNLLSHSAGTMYAMNTMFHLRHLLEPKAPYVGLIAPWVHSNHSQAALWAMASKLPADVIGKFDSMMRFMNAHVLPVTSWSGDLFSGLTSVFRKDAESATTSAAENAGDGMTAEMAQEVEKTARNFFFAESTSGVSEEVMLCLKKDPNASWGMCENYEDFVTSQETREATNYKPGGPDDLGKLKVQVYFAESDIMIGKKGQEYFEKCWRQEGVERFIDFESFELPGTNHETSILDMKKGSIPRIFEEIKKRNAQP